MHRSCSSGWMRDEPVARTGRRVTRRTRGVWCTCRG
jgi:hypothetical protein